MVNNSTPYIHSKWYIIYSRPILDFFQLQILWTWPFCTCSKRRILFLLSWKKTESQIHYSTKEYKVFCKTENIRSIKWPLKSTQLFYQFLKSGGCSSKDWLNCVIYVSCKKECLSFLSYSGARLKLYASTYVCTT